MPKTTLANSSRDSRPVRLNPDAKRCRAFVAGCCAWSDTAERFATFERKARSVGVRSTLVGSFEPSPGAALLVGSWGRCKQRGRVDGEQNGRGSTWPAQDSVRGNGTSIPVVPSPIGLPGPSASTQRRTLSTQGQTEHQVLLGAGTATTRSLG